MAASTPTPLGIELEFVRAEQADDPFAFRFARQTYLVRGRGGDYETVELAWNRDLLDDLEQLRRPDRDPAIAARVGEMLRELLEPAGWSAHEATITQARSERRPVHVTIRSAAAELYALPWGLLALKADGQHLGAIEHVLLRYAWPGTDTAAVDTRYTTAPNRILVAWSAAGGAVPAADQIAAFPEDIVQVLPHASYGGIDDALKAAEAEGRPFRVLHLLCHGAQTGSTFGLALDAEDGGRPAAVDAGRLQQLFAPHADVLRLVVVMACDGGNMGEPGNRLGSVAQRLHRAGMRYVVASRTPLSARGSTRITEALYRSMLGGASLERAFIDARDAAAREVDHLDWASLQLYARPADGDAGDVLGTRQEPEPPAPTPPPTEPSKAPEPVAAKTPPAPSTPAPPLPSPASSGRSTRWLIVGLVLGIVAVCSVIVLLIALSDDPEEESDLPELDPACITSETKLPVGARPIDVVFVVDDSENMKPDLAALEKTLPDFARKLTEGGLDPHIVMISGTARATEPGLCIAPPLGSGGCPTKDHNPPLYWRVDQRVGSTDALERVIHDWREYESTLRYDASFHVVVITRGDSAWTPQYFTDQITSGDANYEEFFFHAIVTRSSTTYRELAMKTGGWLADVGDDYGRVLEGLAGRLIYTAGHACEYAIPEPETGSFDADAFNVELVAEQHEPLRPLHVRNIDACPEQGDGWFYDDPDAPKTAVLCESTCEQVQGTDDSVRMVFGCPTLRPE
ncbi:MAG: CHAT domain-containing protein [Myxococcota bacterium]